jgi:hypothetical protein
MSIFERVFYKDMPLAGTAAQHWASQDRAALDGAAQKIEDHGANPWVFISTGQHFARFARAAERAALAEMTSQELKALLPWTEEDWEMLS